jgi:hypothetical protein
MENVLEGLKHMEFLFTGNVVTSFLPTEEQSSYEQLSTTVIMGTQLHIHMQGLHSTKTLHYYYTTTLLNYKTYETLSAINVHNISPPEI